MKSKPLRHAEILGHTILSDNQGFVGLLRESDRYWIHRYAARGRINNYISDYEW